MTDDFEGILLVDKPQGFTSHDVVAKCRKIFQIKKVGHAGTLDPMATGLLVILIGKATKVSQYLMSLDKQYGIAYFGKEQTLKMLMVKLSRIVKLMKPFKQRCLN